MTERLHLSPKHRAVVEALLREHLPGVEVWAYGSRVNGRSHDGSDLDLVLRGPGLKEIPVGQVGDFEEAVRDSTIPFLVEARDWAWLPERFHREIERHYVVVQESLGLNEMSKANQWRRVTLDSVIDLQLSSVDKKSKRNEHPVQLCNYTNVYKNSFIHAEMDFMTATATEREIVKCSLVAGDVVITKDSEKHDDIGVPALVREDIPNLVCGYHLAILRPCSSEIDGTYLFYVLNTDETQQQFHSYANGITRFGLRKSDIGLVEIPLPPLPEQRAIAHILGTLDDKIELNRRMNETLEAMARALFKSWFVDFDPVRAKAALRNHAVHHSPLEGESARQGRSPQASRWGEIRRQYASKTLQRSQTLRQNQTNAEGLLWYYLRNKQLGGYKFRRQQPIGPYIADFACLPEKLLIEVDGGQHAEPNATSDEQRERFLRERGYRVLRFWNHEVFADCFGVLERVYEALSGPPPHQPAPGGLASATPPQGGSDWNVERARAYLDRMDPGIAALFPDRLVASELGEIPEGWTLGTLRDIASLNPESWTARRWPEKVEYVDLTNTKWGYIESVETFFWDEAPSRARRVLRKRDTILATVRPGNGSFALIDKDGLTGSTGFAVLRPQKIVDREFVWCAATSSDNIGRLAHLADGGAYPAVRPDAIVATPVVLADLAMREAFSVSTEALFDQIEANKRQSRILAAQRDALLPKLVSGQLRRKVSANE